MTSSRRAVLTLLVAATTLLAPAAAQARDLLSTTLTAPRNEDRDCTTRLLHGAAQPGTSLTAPAGGWLTARLEGDGPGDWDLAIFEPETGRMVAGSASFGDVETAQGIVGTGAPLTIQACRRSGATRTAKLSVTLYEVTETTPVTAQQVKISVPSRARGAELDKLGLDLTEHARPGYREAVLYGPKDAQKLRDAKFTFTTEVADLVARDRDARAAEKRSATTGRALPSGRTGSYRRLPDYGEDMKKLVRENPGLVKAITLPHPTYEGRTVEGIEITENVGARDGKPIFLNMGIHHAREWPSGEHAIEWAFELIRGYKAGEARTVNLVRNTRNIIVPVVNPDGFNISRESGEAQGAGGGRPYGDETANIASHPFEYRRKNCRLADDSAAGNCMQPSVGLAEPGVDPNRNYGGFWGGPGADTNPLTQTYRGPGPFSEPETQNIRELISTRQVMTFITNHTSSDLVLRPPGLQVQGPSPDEGIYKALGDSMAAENGYLSQLSYQLYDTTGTTEDWSYYATGGLGFTFEIGCGDLDRDAGTCKQGNFHPPYDEGVRAEWEGTSDVANPIPGTDGNREAYYKALEVAADASKHALLEGTGPGGAILRVKKSFTTRTFPQADGKPIEFDDTLNSSMEIPADGRYAFHINQSTRPIVAVDKGRPATGPASPPQTFSGDVSGAAPGGDAESNDPANFNDHPFTVPTAGVDNARASVRIDWDTPTTDWDMQVFRDGNGDGDSEDAQDQAIGSSQQGTTTYEETTIAEPTLEPGEHYVVRVTNFAAVEPYEGKITFGGPPPFEPAKTESWTLSCERPNGEVLSSQQITIGRGERQTPDLSACAAALGAVPIAATPSSRACASAAILRSVKATAAGHGVRFAFSKSASQTVDVDVFQVAVGRKVIGERLVARFRGKARSFTWSGRSKRKRVKPGYFFARYSIRLANGQRDVRRKVLRLKSGRFSARPDFYRRDTCGLLRSYKLERAAFGGKTRKPLRAAFRLTRAGTVRLQVLRGKQVVRTLVKSKRFAAGRTHRASLGVKGLRKGDYKLRITVKRAGRRTAKSTLTSRRL
jgi:hypothetical protein